MEVDISSILLGILTGGVITSLIWGTFQAIAKGRTSKDIARRNELINAIGDILVLIDNLLIEKRSGSIDNEIFKRSLTDKVNEINKLFKPNLHEFDVYYVKYIDAVVERFAELMRSGIQTFHYDNKDEFEAAYQNTKEHSSVNFSLDSDPNVTLPGVDSVSDDEPVFEEKSKLVTSVPTEPASKEDADKVKIVEPIDEQNILKMPDVTDETYGTDNKIAKIMPVDDADLPQKQMEDTLVYVNKEDLEHESREIAAASIPENQVADISFEEMARDVLSNESKAEEPKIGFAPITPKGTPYQHESGGGEDFTMETIMDLDVTKMPLPDDDVSRITIKKQQDKNEPVKSETQKKLASQKTNKKTQPKDQKQSGSSTAVKTPDVLNKYESPKSDYIESNEVVFEPESLPSANQEKVASATNSATENDTITGDDVADKIDSFFNIDK